MTTNQKIQAVLATGKLGLPEDLWQPGSNYWALGYDMEDREHVITDQQAYDLIAMHWAREMTDDLWRDNSKRMRHGPMWRRVPFDVAMMRGDSEAAISAIYAALCGEDVDD